jgi:hypothetical protein
MNVELPKYGAIRRLAEISAAMLAKPVVKAARRTSAGLRQRADGADNRRSRSRRGRRTYARSIRSRAHIAAYVECLLIMSRPQTRNGVDRIITVIRKAHFAALGRIGTIHVPRRLGVRPAHCRCRWEAWSFRANPEAAGQSPGRSNNSRLTTR